jgi:hypothetical protein
VEEGKIAKEAGESPGREAQQQALAQEVQQLRKALQESCALQRRLAASAQGGGQGRALERKLRQLTHEVGKLQDLLAEREEIMWEKDRQLGKPCYFLSSSGVFQVRRILEELACLRVEG